MLKTLRSIFHPPRPVSEPRLHKRFEASDKPIAAEAVAEDGGWRIDFADKSTVRLFELDGAGVENCMLTYRAQIKSERLSRGAYLEMWCRFPGLGEFFSRGLHNRVSGTTSWSSYETPFYLKQGQRPDMLKLNLVAEGPGTLWISDIEVLWTPLP